MEFPELGKTCGQEGCGQLDFLPLECAHCHLRFCKEHLSPFVHLCAHFKNNVLTDADLAEKERERWQVKCSHSGCNVKELVPINCSRCGNHFCLSHRHSDQHKCTTEQEAAEKLTAAIKAAEIEKSGLEMKNKVQQDIKNKLEDAKAAGGSKGAMATKLALMRLKGRAKGDNAVPQTERIYFIVECPNKEQNPKPLDVFMSKTWSLGKAVDFMARQARIKNRNNIADSPKLHFFKDDLCLSTTFDRTINQILNEALIADGDALVFKYLTE